MQQKKSENDKKHTTSEGLAPSEERSKKLNKWSDYLFYFIGNPTPFFMVWVSLILMYGVVCAYPNEMGQDEFYRFIFFLQKPIVVLINTLALCAALIHTFSCFYLIYKKSLTRGISQLGISQLGINQLCSILTIAGLWIVMLAVSIALLLMVLK